MAITRIFTLLLLISLDTAAQTTQRIPQFSNSKVNVWQTIIYPEKSGVLSMHRHDYDRILVALTDGQLKVTNNRGKFHILTLKKDQAYYLKKDKVGELHQDENLSNSLIKVMVIELR